MAIWIGIDPGKNTGFAVWDGTSRQFRDVSTLPLWKAMEEVRRWCYACEAQLVPFIVIYEDARQRRWFPEDKTESEYRGHLMGAGAAKRDSAIWEEYLSGMHIRCIAHKPTAGTTKWEAEYFAQVTGYRGRTSKHSRDAALLVYGR